MSPIDKLIAAAHKTAETVDALGTRFADQLQMVLRRWERKLGPLVTTTAQSTTSRIVQPLIAAKTRAAIHDVLLDAGYNDLVAESYGSRLDRIVAAVLGGREVAEAGTRISNAFDARIEAIKALHATDLLDEGSDVARELWQATLRGVFVQQPAERILADLYDVIDSSEAHIRTLYDTSISIFGRQVEALQAGDDPETPFAYFGPADDKTRPFCLLHVGKVYTRSQIDAMDNGQIDNVFLTGGGYNCRHTWIEVSAFSALTEIVGTGERIPEVAQQLEAA
jgi:hypothetical protein